MNNFKITNATLGDLDDLTILFDKYRVFYNKTSDLDGAKAFLADRINNGESTIFICRKDNIAMGFAQLYPLFSSTRMRRLWLLNDLYVDAEFRGHGISKALIDACKNFAKSTDACGVMLETNKDNLIANNLYIKTSFEVDKDHNFYFFAT